MSDLRAMPWWTAADAAELEVQVQELVDEVFEHRPGCGVCAAGCACPVVRAAVEAVVEWRDDRMLRSRAAWLRVEQDQRDRDGELELGRGAGCRAHVGFDESGEAVAYELAPRVEPVPLERLIRLLADDSRNGGCDAD